MESAIVNLLMGLGIMGWAMFAFYTGYLRLTGKKLPSADFLGNLVWWYGTVVLTGAAFVSLGTLAILFAHFIIRSFSFGVMLGG